MNVLAAKRSLFVLPAVLLIVTAAALASCFVTVWVDTSWYMMNMSTGMIERIPAGFWQRIETNCGGGGVGHPAP